MTDSILAGSPASLPSSAPITAGGLLRQARQAQGLHIAALAAAIKVAPAKLEALESEQFDRLPDATFTRALAQAMCRSLKIDPAPVLALLPPLNGHRLGEVAEGLKTPFNERPARLVPGHWLKLNGAMLTIAAVLVIGALALYLVPAGWITVPHPGPMSGASSPEPATASTEPTPPGAEPDTGRPDAATTAGATEAPTSTHGAAAVGAVGAASEVAAGVAAAAPPAGAETATATTAATLEFTTTAPSWIGVTDAAGKSLIGRLVLPGEPVGIDGALPLTLRIGHASTVQLKFRGDEVDLKKYTKNDFARFQLK